MAQARPRRLLAALALLPVLMIAVPVGTRVFVLEAFKIPSGSMQPTLLVGDHLFVTKSAYRFGKAPQPGDVIVFEFPENRAQDFVKRVVAVGGDTVSVEKGTPIVNGRPTTTCKAGVHVSRGETVARQSVEVELLNGRRYLTLHERSFGEAPTFGPFVVPPGQVFVMGDNRDNAYDSRGWRDGKGGGVPLDHVKGPAWLVWLSLASGGAANGRAGLHLDGDPVAPADYEPDVIEGVRRCLAPGATFAPR
jgi:signal peptidase I